MKYRLGKVNQDADCLSKVPLEVEKYINFCTQESSTEEVKIILNTTGENKHFDIIDNNKIFSQIENGFLQTNTKNTKIIINIKTVPQK